MPRGKRFKILETAIKKYQAPIGAAGTPFYKYDQFKKGLADYHPSMPEQEPVKRRKAKPFGAATASVPYVISRSSTRALATNIGATGFSLNDLAVSDLAAADDVVDSPNYVPAKMVVFAATGTITTVTASENKVTGTAYKRKAGASYTLPFGQGATPGTSLIVAMGYLSDKAENLTNKSVTFKPERFYGKGA